MKKKLMLIGAMLVVCFGLIFGIKSIQNTSVASVGQNNTAATENSTKAAADNENNKQALNKVTSDTNANQSTTASAADSTSAKTQEPVKNDASKPADKSNDGGSTTNSKSTTNSSITNSNTGANNNGTANNSNTKTDTQKPNLIITNSVTGEKILEANISFEGLTASAATIKALDTSGKSYKVSGFGESTYFSSINGIRERAAGASSGWCYFINGNKLNVGSGTYVLKKDDILEWKYLKDGISN